MRIDSPTEPAYGYPADPQRVHVLDRLSLLHKYRRVVITVLLLVVIVAVIQTYTTIPMYRAQARLLIEDERSALAGFKDGYVTYYQDPEPYYQTQNRILTGRGLAQAVVKRLELEKVPEFSGHGRTRGPDHRGLVDAFLSRVTVEPVRDSRLVDVSFRSASPEFAARAVNALVDEYVQQNLTFKLQATEKTLTWLSEELAKQQKALEGSERALQAYREAKNALSLEERQNIVVARLNQLNEAVTRAQTLRIQKEALYTQIRSMRVDGADSDTFPILLQNPSVQALKGQLDELQRQKLRLSEKYDEKHPDILSLNTRIRDATGRLQAETTKIIESLHNELRSALAEEENLTAALEEQKAVAMDLSRKSVSYTVLDRKALSDRQVYEALLQRERELRVVSNSKANNVRVVDRSDVPRGPFMPKPRQNLTLAVVLGLVLGISLAFGLDYLNDTIKTPDDITQRLRLPVLGLVSAVQGSTMPLLSEAVPHNFGEAFRALRTSLVFTKGPQSTRTVLVTSAQPLEGKTTTTCNLGLALAVGGARVLVIDADMRRPGLHKPLNLENDVGLSHVLVGQAALQQAIIQTTEPNLSVITAGRRPANPSELLASDAMKGLMADLMTMGFDWVILDTPPVLAVTDAVVLTDTVPSVVFVLGAEMTRRRLAERAIERLMSGRPSILGAVLNRVDFARNKYYYSRYHGYQYQSYYNEKPSPV